MVALLLLAAKRLKQFFLWFNTTFAWFFTNGMKEIEDYSEPRQWRIIIPHSKSAEY